MTGRLSAIIASVAVLFSAGCGLDLSRMQANMDRMTCYMGTMASSMPVMVHSTKRMADNADQMQRRANGLLQELREKGKASERTAFNYLQAFHDNDKSMIKALQGIQKELGSIKQSLGDRRDAGPADTDDQVKKNMRAKLDYLEARLAALTAKVEKIDKKGN